MKVLRDRTKLIKMSEEVEDNFVHASPAECLSMMWELTAEVWSMKGSEYVERRLPRHVTNLIRK